MTRSPAVAAAILLATALAACGGEAAPEDSAVEAFESHCYNPAFSGDEPPDGAALAAPLPAGGIPDCSDVTAAHVAGATDPTGKVVVLFAPLGIEGDVGAAAALIEPGEPACTEDEACADGEVCVRVPVCVEAGAVTGSCEDPAATCAGRCEHHGVCAPPDWGVYRQLADEAGKGLLRTDFFRDHADDFSIWRLESPAISAAVDWRCANPYQCGTNGRNLVTHARRCAEARPDAFGVAQVRVQHVTAIALRGPGQNRSFAQLGGDIYLDPSGTPLADIMAHEMGHAFGRMIDEYDEGALGCSARAQEGRIYGLHNSTNVTGPHKWACLLEGSVGADVQPATGPSGTPVEIKPGGGGCTLPWAIPYDDGVSQDKMAAHMRPSFGPVQRAGLAAMLAWEKLGNDARSPLPLPPTPQREVACNGVDDDLDGTADEGCDCVHPTSCAECQELHAGSEQRFGFCLATRTCMPVGDDGRPAPGHSCPELPCLAASRCEPEAGLGVATAGIGLAGRGGQPSTAAITLAGVPANATIRRARLLWSTVGGEAASISFAGTPVTGTLQGMVPGGTCWKQQGSWFYTAEVTAQVTGDGSYAVAAPAAAPGTYDVDTQGASLIVEYVVPGDTTRGCLLLDPVLSRGSSTAPMRYEMTEVPQGFTAARLINVVGDGQEYEDTLVVEGTRLGDGSAFAGAQGQFWDTRVDDVTTLLEDAEIETSIESPDDCLAWHAQGLYLRGVP